MLAGRYEVGELLGRGGLGVVHEAHDTVLDRVVAIKSLREDHADDRTLAQRLDDEARAAASFTHPNAVVLYDVVVADGQTHLVMERIDGGHLPAVLRDGVLPVGLACLVGRDVASALAAAHERGLVHRDVKPSNVLVTRDGMAKLADFGIARMAGRSGARLTQVGTIVGSAAYLAPEQLRDDDVDGRADVYSLGLVLGEVVSGHLGFGDGTWNEVLTRRLTQPPQPLSRRPVMEGLLDLLPDGLEELLVDMTRVDATDRPTAAEVATRLRSFASDDGRARLAARLPDDVDVDPGAPTQAMESLSETRVVSAPPRDRTSVLPAAAVDDEVAEVRWGPGMEGPPPTVADQVDERAEALAGAATAATRRFRRAGPVMWVLAGAIALTAAVVALDVLAGSGDGDGGGTAAPTPGAVITVASVVDLDPLGDGREHPEDLPALIDGNPDTEWETERYNSPTLDKPGVGLVFDLGDARAVVQLELALRNNGVDLEVWSSDEDPGGRPAPEVGQLQAQVEGAASGSLTIDVDATARYWMVWIVRVAEGRATIAEATFR